VVRRADGRILLVQRGREPERGHWGLPGGKVDWMETVEHAVVRETLEETALEVRIERLLCVVDHFEHALQQHWVAPVYLVGILGNADAQLQEPEALTALGWFAPDALPTPLTVSARQAIEHLG
jgi:ADP-ribose pyrophosphatase YjhB (NUDIX family)